MKYPNISELRPTAGDLIPTPYTFSFPSLSSKMGSTDEVKSLLTTMGFDPLDYYLTPFLFSGTFVQIKQAIVSGQPDNIFIGTMCLSIPKSDQPVFRSIRKVARVLEEDNSPVYDVRGFDVLDLQFEEAEGTQFLNCTINEIGFIDAEDQMFPPESQIALAGYLVSLKIPLRRTSSFPEVTYNHRGIKLDVSSSNSQYDYRIAEDVSFTPRIILGDEYPKEPASLDLNPGPNGQGTMFMRPIHLIPGAEVKERLLSNHSIMVNSNFRKFVIATDVEDLLYNGIATSAYHILSRLKWLENNGALTTDVSLKSNQFLVFHNAFTPVYKSKWDGSDKRFASSGLIVPLASQSEVSPLPCSIGTDLIFTALVRGLEKFGSLLPLHPNSTAIVATFERLTMDSSTPITDWGAPVPQVRRVISYDANKSY